MAALSYQRHQTMTVIPGMNAVAFTDDSSEYGAPYVIARSFRFKFSNSRHSRPGPHGSRRRDTPDALILRSGRQAASRRMRHTKTTDTTPHSHGANSPELCTNRFAFLQNRGRRECRVPAAPAASRAK